MLSPALHSLLAAARGEELRRAAFDRTVPTRPRAWAWRRQRLRPMAIVGVEPAVTIRYAFPDDARALARLAALDSREPPAQPLLVAEVDGELHAGLSLVDGGYVADPFRPTAALVELLAARAAQLQVGALGSASANTAFRIHPLDIARTGATSHPHSADS